MHTALLHLSKILSSPHPPSIIPALWPVSTPHTERFSGKWNAYVAAKLSAQNATGNVRAGQQTVHDWEDAKYIAKLYIGK